MADKKPGESRRAPGTRKFTLSMDDLNASLDSFVVEPPSTARGRVVAAEATVEINCTNGATCNFKCGPTAYWECATMPEGGCPESNATNCFSCYPYCVTEYAAGDPFC